MKSFALDMRDRQVRWARESGGIPVAALEERRSWVLKPEHRKLNLFRAEWWDHIKDSEHRWARALNSSQCFAVNLFAPMHDNSNCAKRVLARLLPDRVFSPEDQVKVRFEHTPRDASLWLGEAGQPTQVDIFIEIIHAAQPIGFVLVEVKFTEASFGSCRGWNGKVAGNWTNADRTRCEDIVQVSASPKSRCWLSEREGRHYWQLMAEPKSSLRMEQIARVGACPFRYGLYQMMRNRVLADELARRIPGAWAEFAVCRHHENHAVANLKVAVGGAHDAFEAFRALSSKTAVNDWDAEAVMGAIRSTDDGLATWETWMRKRYF